MKKFIVLSLLLALGLSPGIVGAQSLKTNVTNQLKAGGDTAGYQVKNPKSPQLIVADAIMILLKTVGIVFTSLVLYAGYLYLTSHGEEDRIQKAQRTIRGAVIGLTITLMAYAITNFVAKRIYNASTGADTYNTESSSFQGGFF